MKVFIFPSLFESYFCWTLIFCCVYIHIHLLSLNYISYPKCGCGCGVRNSFHILGAVLGAGAGAGTGAGAEKF